MMRSRNPGADHFQAVSRGKFPKRLPGGTDQMSFGLRKTCFQRIRRAGDGTRQNATALVHQPRRRFASTTVNPEEMLHLLYV